MRVDYVSDDRGLYKVVVKTEINNNEVKFLGQEVYDIDTKKIELKFNCLGIGDDYYQYEQEALEAITKVLNFVKDTL